MASASSERASLLLVVAWMEEVLLRIQCWLHSAVLLEEVAVLALFRAAAKSQIHLHRQDQRFLDHQILRLH